ncbi:uncharacterized protein P884DRAFT_191505 [Thermothelomyces heterothallicus CBS 202.75]|uniref:uncharacterized protein n=1 Tax=Thermothelomyces heterothallicus CBS 202.75 TaxID=1149848 RepID=UPI00374496B1
MDVCYCANYYVLKTGASLSPGRLPDDCLWLLSQPPSREEQDEQQSMKRLRDSRRPSWTFVGISMPSLRLSTTEASSWKNGRANTRTW